MKDKKDIWQNKFSGIKAPLDKDALWSDISNDDRFPRKKKSRKFFFILFFIVGLAAGAYFLNSYDNKSFRKEGILNGEVIETKGKGEGIEEITFNNISGDNNSSKINDSNSLGEGLVDKRGNISDVDVNYVNKYSLEKVSIQNNSDVNINSSQLSPPKSVSNIGLVNRVKEYKSTGYLKVYDTASDSRNMPEPKKIKEKKVNQGNVISVRVEEINEELVLLEQIPIHITQIPIEEKWTELKKIDIVPKEKKWTISLGSGLGYALINYNYQEENAEDTLLFVNEADVLQRINYTKNITSFRHSLQLERQLKKDWSLGLGVQYTSLNQRFYYEDKVEGDIEVIEDSLGTHVQQIINFTNYELFHNYKALDINIFFGKNISFDKIDVFAKAGLSLNTYFKPKGKYLNTNLFLLGVNEIPVYEKRLGLSYFGELGISKSIAKNISCFTSFSYQSPLRMTKRKSSLNQKSSTFFLNVGLKFDL